MYQSQHHCYKRRFPINQPPEQAGLAFLSLLLTIVVIGITATSALQWGIAYGQRDAEAQLLFVGEEIQKGLASYAEATPVGFLRAPSSLQELIRDPRYPGVVRHLRQLYVDPFTGKADWAVILDPFGRIVAVHSRSKLKPIKTTAFEPPLENLETRKAKTYEEWLFGEPGMSAAFVPTSPSSSMSLPDVYGNQAPSEIKTPY